MANVASVSSTNGVNSKDEMLRIKYKLTDDEYKLFSSIPNEEFSIGNINLRKTLGWDEEKYWNIRTELIRKNLIAIGAGKGGSVYRILNKDTDIVVSDDKNAIGEIATLQSNVVSIDKKELLEKDYYPLVNKYITSWARDNGYTPGNFFVCDTAQGNKKTGKWSRPDITFISVESFIFQPRKYLDVISFEIKPPFNIDITSVFETAAHTRFANKSYLLQIVPEDQSGFENDLKRIESECKRFGLGLIKCNNAEEYESYEEIVEPTNRLPDPREVEKFIKEQIVSDEVKTSLMLLLK